LRAVLVAASCDRDVEQAAPSALHIGHSLFRAAGASRARKFRATFERSQQPDFRFVDVAVTLAPPLPEAIRARKSERLSVRRGAQKNSFV
jgi:hypothetical protein